MTLAEEILKIQPDVSQTIETQQQIIHRLSESNKKLKAFNKFASSREVNLSECTAKLIHLKTQLELVHKRIKTFKTTIRKDHPRVYQEAVDSLPPLPEDLQD